MNGEEHVILSLLSAGVILTPLLGSIGPIIPLVCLIGVFIGSLAPDADTPASSIMHGFSGRQGRLRSVKRHTIIFLPLFGYILRYLVFYPASAVVWLFTLGREKPRHRGVMHSLLGAVIAALVIGLILYGTVVILAGFDAKIWIYAFLSGFLFGYLMHLIEDSCTRHGVRWLYPLSKAKLSGNLAAESSGIRLSFVVVAGAFLFVLISSPVLHIPVPEGGGLAYGFIILSIAWVAVMAVAGVHS
ncbi:metal-dependent hydrolase [Methanoplanus endosymbiosus]|uniref:Metal-dependent hydrolase n=1 Tax=Methanoplanus endosymbiosus TaxID=33865 RepID=A0A9E7PJY5_9EURY|nr:metal-dependent hydrolase [Methanoplanus endosymbiosus]UUX91358.1 metal-dependent hydrolase [Methanoplanus endosymbiosus]